MPTQTATASPSPIATPQFPTFSDALVLQPVDVAEQQGGAALAIDLAGNDALAAFLQQNESATLNLEITTGRVTMSLDTRELPDYANSGQPTSEVELPLSDGSTLTLTVPTAAFVQDPQAPDWVGVYGKFLVTDRAEDRAGPAVSLELSENVKPDRRAEEAFCSSTDYEKPLIDSARALYENTAADYAAVKQEWADAPRLWYFARLSAVYLATSDGQSAGDGGPLQCRSIGYPLEDYLTQ